MTPMQVFELAKVNPVEAGKLLRRHRSEIGKVDFEQWWSSGTGRPWSMTTPLIRMAELEEQHGDLSMIPRSSLEMMAAASANPKMVADLIRRFSMKKKPTHEEVRAILLQRQIGRHPGPTAVRRLVVARKDGKVQRQQQKAEAARRERLRPLADILRRDIAENIGSLVAVLRSYPDTATLLELLDV